MAVLSTKEEDGRTQTVEAHPDNGGGVLISISTLGADKVKSGVRLKLDAETTEKLAEEVARIIDRRNRLTR